MMLISPQLKIGLVTIHTALRDVAQQITREKLFEKLEIIDNSLKKDFRIKDPHTAILALNPHAGEHGLIGTEEDSLLSPFLVEAKAKGFFADGPFPADVQTEWVQLASPERIQQLAETTLNMSDTATVQLSSLTQLPRRGEAPLGGVRDASAQAPEPSEIVKIAAQPGL